MNKTVPPIKSDAQKSTDVGANMSTTQLAPDVFGAIQKMSIQALAELAVSRLSNQHRPTANVKTRGEVEGSTRKPWRQKGTGRARVGTKRTPLWRGGGRIFGPTSNRNYQKKINRAVISPSLKWALQQKATYGKLEKISNLENISSAKTKTVLAKLGANLHARGTLIVIDQKSTSLQRALANVKFVNVKLANQLNFLDVTNANHILITESGLSILQAKFK